MGWWRIEGPSGGVAWSPRAGEDGGAVMFNYIPGKHYAGNLYNGDEPADILDAVLSQMADKLTEPAYLLEVRYIFLGSGAPPVFVDAAEKQAIYAARQKIIRTYKREWRREPFDDELSALFEFCTSFLKHAV